MNKEEIEYVKELADILRFRYSQSESEDIRMYHSGFNTAVDVFRDALLDHFSVDE